MNGKYLLDTNFIIFALNARTKLPLLTYCYSPITKIEEQGKLEIRDKVKSILNQCLRYAVSTGKLESNPARDLSNDVFTPKPKNNFATQTTPDKIREVYRTITKPYNGYKTLAKVNHFFLQFPNASMDTHVSAPQTTAQSVIKKYH